MTQEEKDPIEILVRTPIQPSEKCINLALHSEYYALAGNAAFAFKKTVSSQLMTDIKASFFYSQVVATKADPSLSMKWHKTYEETLAKVGWKNMKFNFSPYISKTSYVNVVDALIDAYSSKLLDDEECSFRLLAYSLTKRANVTTHACLDFLSTSSTNVSFQLGCCFPYYDRPVVKMLAANFVSESPSLDYISCLFQADGITLQTAFVEAEFDEKKYANVRESVQKEIHLRQEHQIRNISV